MVGRLPFAQALLARLAQQARMLVENGSMVGQDCETWFVVQGGMATSRRRPRVLGWSRWPPSSLCWLHASSIVKTSTKRLALTWDGNGFMSIQAGEMC